MERPQGGALTTLIINEPLTRSSEERIDGSMDVKDGPGLG